VNFGDWKGEDGGETEKGDEGSSKGHRVTSSRYEGIVFRKRVSVIQASGIGYEDVVVKVDVRLCSWMTGGYPDRIDRKSWFKVESSIFDQLMVEAVRLAQVEEGKQVEQRGKVSLGY
jgi:hypothetical protein